MDELNAMTYLDYVTREVLRLHSPASNTNRVPTRDFVVPLSEPFIDRHGVKRHEFRRVLLLCVKPQCALVLTTYIKDAQGRSRHRSNSCHSENEIIVGRRRRGVQVSVPWPAYTT
jgi:hypothetical protein